MQANLSHYEDVAELEDDILCFLPTVSDLEVFGCELELLDLREQQPLSEAFRAALLQRPQLQMVVRPCMVEGHSIWQFQADGKESYPKARVLANLRGEIADRAFYAAPSIRHVEVATGIQHTVFFPRVRTPCGHGAQVIVEGREEKTDGGERNEDPKKKPTQNQTPKPAGRLHHLVVFPIH